MRVPTNRGGIGRSASAPPPDSDFPAPGFSRKFPDLGTPIYIYRAPLYHYCTGTVRTSITQYYTALYNTNTNTAVLVLVLGFDLIFPESGAPYRYQAS